MPNPTSPVARPNFEWPDGSWKNVPYSQIKDTENLFYGTGPLYQNAGGFGGPVNNPGTNQVSPFNPAVAQH
jgi:hypothetical protein